jgi:hypothetical protein
MRSAESKAVLAGLRIAYLYETIQLASETMCLAGSILVAFVWRHRLGDFMILNSRIAVTLTS